MQPEDIEFWIDLNLPPKMATWLKEDFNVLAKSFAELGFGETADAVVYKTAAKNSNTIIITTKDIDFINLQNDIGHPPKILYLNVGNVSNKQLKEIISKHFKEALQLFITTNNILIEISL
jgi:predicted nuclease of predicted toxin-antitoxin system